MQEASIGRRSTVGEMQGETDGERNNEGMGECSEGRRRQGNRERK